MSQAQTAPVISQNAGISPEDLLRAQCYRLLSRFLSTPPATAELGVASKLTGDDSELGKAITTFAHVSAHSDATSVADEFHTLFIGLARGELVPYGSYYLTGFLHEKPLSKLRQDMVRLGVERRQDIAEPEDHIASVCEMMAGFIDGSFGRALPLEEQKAFFAVHVASWAPVLFRDMEEAKASVLYAALGSVGRAFLAIEERAFAMT